MTAIRFVVPGNPIPWERSRSRNGRHFTAPRSRQFRETVQFCAKAAKAKPIDGPVVLSAMFYRKDAQPCDIDNLAKAIQDALNGIAYGDDRQIVTLVAVKTISRWHPRTEIEVMAAGPCALQAGGGGVDAALEDHEDSVAERRRAGA